MTLVTYDDMKDAKDVLTAAEYTGVFQRLTEKCSGLEETYEVHRALGKDIKRNEIALARKSVFQERRDLQEDVASLRASLEMICRPYYEAIKKHRLFPFG